MNHSRHDSFVYWVIWAFALAFIVVILATAKAAMSEALATTSSRSQTLSAPSADSGKPMEARPACVGVRTPGSARRENRNAVESILSHDLRWTASWCGFGAKTILQCPAMAFATKLPARGPSDFVFFPGVTVQFSGADVLPFLIRESDTASCRAQAAPGNLLVSARSQVHSPCATSLRLIADARRGMTRPGAHHSALNTQPRGATAPAYAV